MTRDKAKKTIDQAIEDLSVQSDQGKSQKLLDFLAAMSKFRRYSLCNVALSWTRRPGATDVACFRT